MTGCMTLILFYSMEMGVSAYGESESVDKRTDLSARVNILLAPIRVVLPVIAGKTNYEIYQ